MIVVFVGTYENIYSNTYTEYQISTDTCKRCTQTYMHTHTHTVSLYAYLCVHIYGRHDSFMCET